MPKHTKDLRFCNLHIARTAFDFKIRISNLVTIHIKKKITCNLTITFLNRTHSIYSITKHQSFSHINLIFKKN